MPNRFVVWGVLFLLVIPFSLLVSRWLKQPTLYPGDRLEYRTCRECGGRGINQGMEEMPDGPGMPRNGGPCIGCGGKNKVPVVIPGPNHPSKVKGSVFEGKARPEAADPEAAAMADFMDNRDPRQPVRGAIAQARVVFEKSGQKVEVSSNLKGRFMCRLAPGEWKYTATADGFQPATGSVFVPLRTEPIYKEDATIIGPDEAGALDHTGLPCPIPMSK